MPFVSVPMHYHPDPNKAKAMEGVETLSQELSTQEFNDSVIVAEDGVMPGFVTVTRSKKVHWLKFPVSSFAKGHTKTSMLNWVMANLRKYASIKPNTFSVTTLPTVNGEPASFLLFQVYTAEEAKAACGCGSVDAAGNITNFEIYTPEEKALQESRMLKVISLSFNTTADHISAALSKYGCIESVTTRFNAKATMVNATVIFKYADAVVKLKERFTQYNKAYVRVRDDIGTVTWLGDTPIKYDSLLTRKMAHLPSGLTPVDIKRFFNKQFATPNAVRAFHSITMPVNLHSKKRHPEAYIHFATPEQLQLATAKSFEIGGHMTCWLDVTTPTCHQCGDPSHFVKSCQVKLDRANSLSLQRSNISSIKGRTQSTSTATRPLTQVPNSDASTPAKKQATFARTTSSMSYSSAARAGKNQGSAASNPITIGSSTSQATASTTGAAAAAITTVTSTPVNTATQPAAAGPSVAATSAPVNWATHFTTTISNLALKQHSDIIEVHARIQAVADTVTANMKAEFAQMMAVIQGKGSQQYISTEAPVTNTTPTLEQEDIDIPEAPASPVLVSTIVVPDSLPASPAATEPPLFKGTSNDGQTHNHPETPPVKEVPYSIKALRPHPSGESSIGKSDSRRGEVELTRKDTKGKGTLRNTSQDVTTVPEISVSDLLHELQEQRKMMESLAALVQDLRNSLAQKEAENEQLRNTLTSRPWQNNNGSMVYWANMSSQEVREYGEVPHHGSATPNLHHEHDVNTQTDIQETQSNSDL